MATNKESEHNENTSDPRSKSGVVCPVSWMQGKGLVSPKIWNGKPSVIMVGIGKDFGRAAGNIVCAPSFF